MAPAPAFQLEGVPAKHLVTSAAYAFGFGVGVGAAVYFLDCYRRNKTKGLSGCTSSFSPPPVHEEATTSDTGVLHHSVRPCRCTDRKPTLKNERPIIISHRGASGYRPEHTLESYHRAMKQGADFIELDVVSTKDGHLIVRHDVTINDTTNVEQLPQFKDRRRKRYVQSVDGDHTHLDGFFACDFTLEEIKQLEATQRWIWRNIDGEFIPTHRYRVPTLAEVAAFVKQTAKDLGRAGQIGLYIETKRANWHEEMNLPLERCLVSTLLDSNFDGPIILQSFEAESLRKLKQLQPQWQRIKLCIDARAALQGSVDPSEALPDSGAELDSFLKGVAAYANGIGPWKNQIIPDPTQPVENERSEIVEKAHQHGLVVHPYTFRSDVKFLHQVYGGNATEEYARFFRLGVDGVFTDFASHAYHAREVFFMLGDDFVFNMLDLNKYANSTLELEAGGARQRHVDRKKVFQECFAQNCRKDSQVIQRVKTEAAA